jgi:superfamily II DNA or RNA helicase
MGLKDWKHQSLAIERYAKAEYAGLLFDCGTGKTRTAIKIAEKKGRPVIVIAPKNLMTRWEDAVREDSESDDNITFTYDSSKEKTKKYQAAFDKFLKA